MSDHDFDLDPLNLISKDELLKKIETLNEKIEQYDRKIFQMRALIQSGKGLGDILQLTHLLETFQAVVRERYGSVNSTVMLLDDLNEQEKVFRIYSYFGIPETYWTGEYEEETFLFKFPRIDGLLWQIIQQGAVFSVQDSNHKPRFTEAWKKWNLGVLYSDVWCPLIKKGEVLGILTLGLCKNGEQIQDLEYGFLQDLASIAVTNIDSVIKYEKNETILKNVKTLYDINQQLADVHNFKQLCEESLASAARAVRAQRANMMLFNGDTRKLEIAVVWGTSIPYNVRQAINSGKDPQGGPPKAFALGEGMAGKCAQQKRPIRANGRENIEQIGENMVYAMLSVPLIRGQEVVGVINMVNKVKYDPNSDKMVLDTLGRFTVEDETLMVGLADQTAANLHKAHLYSASVTDKMTNLLNTGQFDFEINRYVDFARQKKEHLTLAIIDIDHFKNFNDTHGHKAGDVVLKGVANLLNKQRRSETKDMTFRYGGEEFCFLMPNTDAQTSAEVVEDFRAKVASLRIKWEGQLLKVTISIGLASFPTEAMSAKELFSHADKALYAAKAGGRNQVHSYSLGAITDLAAQLAESIEEEITVDPEELALDPEQIDLTPPEVKFSQSQEGDENQDPDKDQEKNGEEGGSNESRAS